MDKWINAVGEICNGKDGKGKYIKVRKDFNALKGNNITLQSFPEYLEGLVKGGFITKEEKESRLEKVTWVKYILNLPPQEKKEDDNSKPSKSGWINNAVELRESKAGKLYLQVCRDFEVGAGSSITLTDFADHIEFLFEKDYIDEETKEKRMKLREFIHFVGSVPPSKD